LAPSTSNDPESENGSLPSSSGVKFTKVAMTAVVWLVDQLLRFFEIAFVLVRFDHVASIIVNADHSVL
jgi:hypothetical protein